MVQGTRSKVRRRSLANAREGSRALVECRQTRRPRPVNLLMAQPVNNFTKRRAIYFVPPNAIIALKLVEPTTNRSRSVVVVWVENAREHSGGRAKPPCVIGDGPEHDEQQPRFARKLTNRFRLRKFRFDGSDAAH